MKPLNWRAGGLLVWCAGWAYACGGSDFHAAGSGAAPGTADSAGVGGSALGGSSATAGDSTGGDSTGGVSTAGVASGGAPGGVAGVGAAGASDGGTSAGGVGGNPSGGAVASGGSAGSGVIRNSGDCLTDKECGAGNTCVALYPGGFRTCVAPVPGPATCTAASTCCPGITECAAGSTCVETPLAPSCGLVTRPTIVCAPSACSKAADCTGNNAICAPAGSLDRKVDSCLTGGCRLDKDCTASAGGKCEPVTPNCCSGPSGLYCVYPGKGCRTSSDCAAGATCQIVSQKTGECVTGAGLCAG
jgi:hypothetical protein